MKKQNLFVHATAVYFKKATLSLLVALFFTASSFAQTLAAAPNPILKTVAVKHLCTIENKQFFQVQLDNEANEKFSLTIKDAHDEVLYQENFQDKKFDKKFQLNKPEGEGDSKLSFIVRTLKDNQSQAFEVATTTKMTEAVVVKRVAPSIGQ